LGAAVGGIILFGPAFGWCERGDDPLSTSPAQRRCRTKHFVGGGIVFGLSSFLGVVGVASTPHPVSASKRREIADRYNQKLKDELGLPDDYSPNTENFDGDRAPIRVDFGLQPRSGGGAATFRLQF
jgi:hypothetical protein